MSTEDFLIIVVAGIVGIILCGGCGLSCAPAVDMEVVKAVYGLPAHYTPAIKCSRSF